MMTEAQISLGALALLYVFLIGDWFHRAWAALGVAGLLVLLHVITIREALSSIDINTISLLLGMMVLVGLLGQAGLFFRFGLKARQIAKGEPRRLLWVFFILTAVISAFLDNVTTILLLSPALFRAAEGMDLDPVPFLMAMVAASNLGGLGTLIGDPPNILIGTAANLSFNAFIAMLGLPALILLIGVAVTLPWRFKWEKNPQGVVVDPYQVPSEFPLAHRLMPLLGVLGLVLIAFVLQRVLHVSSGEIAIGGATLGLIVSGPRVGRFWTMVDWGTLGFFVGIFVLVGALEHGGVISHIARFLASQQLGNGLALIILLGSAILSALVDNVPLVAAMIPLIRNLLHLYPGYGMELWVALAMGAAIGGNATIIGASANVVAQGLAQERGYSLNFRRYLPFGLQVFAVTLILGTLYITVVA
ncbi:SLC13 family permease [Sulfobacillus thermosulfidooxidans]|uniref:SLC13 family permease n=1 Tax=Sulfobacillus thermosulfidooxidans TaxID=28034 RepID=UPI0002F5D8A2|nr:SLC13 family permease [Sulfobacillus thermosulfidooxidans]